MTLDEKNKLLRGLKPDTFLALGAPHVVYVREVAFQGKNHFAIYSADGKALALAPDLQQAIDTMASQELEPVRLH